MDPGFYALLVLDAVLSGAYGMNLWSSFRTPAPQRSARLYRRLVRQGLASSVNGSLLPTELPFVYIISATVSDGTPLPAVESALLEALDAVAAQGITPAELTKAKAQLKARLVFDNDSVTNIAHQLGYFETIASVDVFHDLTPRIAAVTLDEVATVARTVFSASNRTIGWFDPTPVS
jgi:zinc protease